MGLSAGQARLLTITGRKANCEFESMRISHQKIALTRQLADLSNEYQNSLTQTKLIYDFYGKGDTSTQLSYGILMSPSALNNYMPTLITDSLGRVTLNSKLAKAAQAAGIPQEGLGSLPSDSMRNAFIQGLGKVGVITDDMAKKIQGIPYNQEIGFGGGTTVAISTQQGNVDELCKYLNNVGAVIDINFHGNYDNPDGTGRKTYANYIDNSGWYNCNNAGIKSYNLGDLINGSQNFEMEFKNGHKAGVDGGQVRVFTELLEDIFNQVDDCLSSVLDLGDGYSAKALEYARTKVSGLIDDETNYLVSNKVDFDKVQTDTKNYIGWIEGSTSSGFWGGGHGETKARINLNNILNAYLTYFADYMNGISATDVYGKQVFEVNRGWKNSSSLALSNKSFQYTWKAGTDVSSGDLGQAAFYDALFNQLCAKGWTENDEINNNQYLQEMLQSGRLYVSRTKDDGYYYQGNYATDTYIKEVSDDTLIARAEAKYNTEKTKLNQKEETLDLKMKNLDTEISSLTTEYDTVKNTISKNIEKSFKRFNA